MTLSDGLYIFKVNQEQIAPARRQPDHDPQGFGLHQLVRGPEGQGHDHRSGRHASLDRPVESGACSTRCSLKPDSAGGSTPRPGSRSQPPSAWSATPIEASRPLIVVPASALGGTLTAGTEPLAGRDGPLGRDPLSLLRRLYPARPSRRPVRAAGRDDDRRAGPPTTSTGRCTSGRSRRSWRPPAPGRCPGSPAPAPARRLSVGPRANPRVAPQAPPRGGLRGLRRARRRTRHRPWRASSATSSCR